VFCPATRIGLTFLRKSFDSFYKDRFFDSETRNRSPRMSHNIPYSESRRAADRMNPQYSGNGQAPTYPGQHMEPLTQQLPYEPSGSGFRGHPHYSHGHQQNYHGHHQDSYAPFRTSSDRNAPINEHFDAQGNPGLDREESEDDQNQDKKSDFNSRREKRRERIEARRQKRMDRRQQNDNVDQDEAEMKRQKAKKIVTGIRILGAVSGIPS